MKSAAVFAILLLGFINLRAAEPFDRIAISAFGNLDSQKIADLLRGEVFTETNTSMKFRRGISSQALYVAAASPEMVAKLLLNENPTAKPELEVYQYHAFRGDQDAQFETLKLDPKIDPIRKLLNAMAKPDDLQLSKAELTAVAVAAHDPKAAAAFWAKTLRTRYEAFRAGGLAALPDYETGDGKFSALAELRSVLAEEPALARHYNAFLTEAAIFKTAPAIAPQFYWSVSNVNKLATPDLGVVHAQNAGDHWQMIDADYYVASGYLVSLTLYELWPIPGAAQPQTLIWQSDLVSATGLAGGFGVKRKIASLLIQNDLKTSAHALQEDAAKAH